MLDVSVLQVHLLSAVLDVSGLIVNAVLVLLVMLVLPWRPHLKQ